MKNIDVEIYFSQLRGFFENNPNDLISLIGETDREVFYEKLRDIAYQNYEKGDDITLTNQQLMGAVMDIISLTKQQEKKLKTFFETKYGKVCMN